MYIKRLWCIMNSVIQRFLCISYFCQFAPKFVAQLDAPSDWRPGGRGFNPRRGWQHSFLEIDHEIFSTVILSLFLAKECAQYWLTAYRTKPAQ